MTIREIALATEDELSEAVGERLLEEAGATPSMKLRRGGFGYLKKSLKNFAKMTAPHSKTSLLLLTDLDSSECAPSLIRAWTRGIELPGGLLFRVAIREIEAWLLGDPEAIRALLGKNTKVPRAPETLADPKQTLLQMARRAPGPVKRDLVAKKGAAAAQGLGYNHRLVNFVHTSWSPARAAVRCPSLKRARAAIEKLTHA